AQVPPQILNPSLAASVTGPLPGLLYAAKSFDGRGPRLFRIHPAANVLLFLLFDVVTKFCVKFALVFSPTKQRPQHSLQSVKHSSLLALTPIRLSAAHD